MIVRLLAVSTAAVCLLAQPVHNQPLGTLDVAARMEALHVPGVSVAIIDGYRIVWTHAYGLADIESSRPVGVQTRFQAASISKPVAATAALKLVEEGKLYLDQDVNSQLRSWKVPANQLTAVEKVTLRRLLSHSAGLGVHGFPGYDIADKIPTLVEILDGVKPANTEAVRVEKLPGSEWSYSGGGITIVQLLMTEATGKPFPEFLRDVVLSKIGMRDSTYQQPLPESLRKDAASASDRNGHPIHGKWHVYPEMAAAGLWTTPSDLARFAIELQLSQDGKANLVISQSMTNQMLTRQKGDWGLGIGLAGHGAGEQFTHSGGNAGFKCLLTATRHTGQGVVTMTNGDQGGTLTDEIQKAVAAEYHWPKLEH